MILRIILRNLLGHPVRTLFTSLAAASCVVAFLLLRTVSAGWVSTESKDTNVLYSRHSMSMLARFPVKTVGIARKLEFVDHVSQLLIFPTLSTVKDNEINGGSAVDPEEYLAVLADVVIKVDGEQRKRWVATRDGALIGDKLAAQEHWSVGDVIAVRSPAYPLADDQTWKFTISGIYKPISSLMTGDQLIAHYDYVNEAIDPAMRDLAQGLAIRTKGAISSADAARAVDQSLSEIAPTITVDASKASQGLTGMFASLFTLLDTLATIFVGVVVLLLVNTVTLGVRERTAHFAVLRAMGFRGPTICAVIAGESAVLGFVGTLIGCVFAHLLVNKILAPVLAESSSMPPIHLTTMTMALTLAAAMVLGALAGVPAFASIMHRRLTDALRFVG